MISAWRVADPEFGKTPQEMLSGEGAYLHGGRWNSKGVRVVYLGSTLALAGMELLVHLGRSDVLKTYAKMRVWLPTESIQHISLDDLPDDWAEETMASKVQDVGNDWIADQGSLILQVPSAVIQEEYNYLINPLHPDFKLITHEAITPFNYDHRLLK